MPKFQKNNSATRWLEPTTFVSMIKYLNHVALVEIIAIFRRDFLVGVS